MLPVGRCRCQSGEFSRLSSMFYSNKLSPITYPTASMMSSRLNVALRSDRVNSSMSVATSASHWLDILEKEFDKAFIDLDKLLDDEEEDLSVVAQAGRTKMATMSSCFTQLAHKVQTIAQLNTQAEVSTSTPCTQLIRTTRCCSGAIGRSASRTRGRQGRSSSAGAAAEGDHGPIAHVSIGVSDAENGRRD